MWERREACGRVEGRRFRLGFSLGVGVTYSCIRPQAG